MGRFSWLNHCPKSVVRNWLFRQHLPSLESVFCQFDLSASHRVIPRRTLYNFGCAGKTSDFATARMLPFNRFIHATGFGNSSRRDYYEVLGVSENASREDIKKAFHALAKQYHPDANKNNPSAKKKFQEIREAYETLQNSERRSQYDEMRQGQGSSRNMNYSTGGAEGYTYSYQTAFSDSFQKIFSEIFENETENLTNDLQVELSLSFSEAAEGCIKHLSFDAPVPCDSCHGLGHPMNAKMRVCKHCDGIGKVTIPPFTALCSNCKGSGRIITEHCKTCKGAGMVDGVKEVKVTIPAGVDSGDTIRVPGAGNAGRRSQPGTLFIKLKVAEDHIFQRVGVDIYVDCNISFSQAILGGHVEVPTLSGKTQLKIPKGVQHGQLTILRGKGLQKNGFFVDHGDQYVRFCIKFPTVVNERQRIILEEFAREEIEQASNMSQSEDNWWQRILEHVTSPKFIMEFSVVMLILLLVNKVLP